MNKSALSHALPLAAAGALLVVFPFVGGKFYVDLMVTTMILGIFALSLELLVGLTGLVSFGHAAFFGIAAYATALLAPQAAAASIAWLLPAVLAITTLAAAAIGALSLRTRGIYFIMVTLAFAQMAYFVFHDMKFAGGSDGLCGSQRHEVAAREEAVHVRIRLQDILENVEALVALPVRRLRGDDRHARRGLDRVAEAADP